MNLRTAMVVVVGMVGLLGCKKGNAAAFKALDKHAIEYGQCELMAESKDSVDGQPAWIASNVCRAKHRKAVMSELEDTKTFEASFDAWKKENGAKAVADARLAPKPAGTAATKSGDDCPNGTVCMNRCKDDCESKHGKALDTAAMTACSSRGGKPEDCARAGMNSAFTTCFRSCRGI